MSNLEILIDSVERRKPVSFEYNKPEKTPGTRFGNVHAIYIFTAGSGEQSTKLHIVQTSGVSDTSDRKPLPSWRNFNISNISNVRILEKEETFAIDPLYKPQSPLYSNPIAKV